MGEALHAVDLTPPGPVERDARLSLPQLLAYAFPCIGTHFTLMLMGLYFIKFGVDVLLVAPGVMGALMVVSRLWDAVSDPIAGYLSDRTRTRYGRRRPWIAASALPFGISIVMLWSPPASLSESAVVVWVGAALLLFYTAYTGLMVPYGALGAELSQDYHDRTRLFAWRQALGALGMVLGVGAFYLLLEAETPDTAIGGLDSREAASAVAFASLVLVCASAAVLVALLRERPDYRDRGPERIFGAFADVARNPHARTLLGVQALHYFSMVTLTMVAGFMFQHVMKLPTQISALLVGCYVAGSFGAIPLWLRLSVRYGKHRLWRASLAAVGCVYAGMFFALRGGMSQDVLAIAVGALASAFVGATQSGNFMLSHSMQADVIDYDEHETGERKEGSYLATWSFVEKCAGALAAGLIGVALELVGYSPGGEQSEATRLAILGLMSLVPALCHLAAALLLRGFALDQLEHARIRQALDARRDARLAP